MRTSLRFSIAMLALIGMLVHGAALEAASSAAAGAAPAANATSATPRLADGKPDFSGYWRAGRAYGGGGGAAAPSDGIAVMPARNGRLQNLENDSFISQKSLVNVPQYKPEYWAKVRDLDLHGNREDPSFFCYPPGLPRIGPPIRVISLPGEVILFQNGSNPPSNMFRFIKPGRKRTRVDTIIPSWYGKPEAHWEGDTLVIDSIGFNDQSWLGWGGFFHTDEMRVIERLSRQGDVLTYDVVVEDPKVLTEPWHVTPVSLQLDANPNANIPEVDPCIERDAGDIVNDIRG